MRTPLSVLFIAGSADFAGPIAQHLHRAGFDVQPERVDSAAAMRDALARRSWDIAVCDLGQRRFSPAAALELLQGSGRDIPFIVVSAIGGAAAGAALMRAGAERLSKLSLAVEQSPNSILITDLDARIEYVNATFMQVTGYALEEVIGKRPSVLHTGKTPPERYRELWATLARGETWHGEFINRRKDGSEYVEFAHISPIRQPDGRVTHYLAIKEDVTAAKRIAAELELHRDHLEELVVERTARLEAANLALASAKEAAEAADRAKDEFLANMSHEIRTPMNAIIGLSGLALRKATDGEQRDYLEKIHGAGEDLLGIINDVLDLSKIAAGMMTLEHTSFCLEREIGKVMAVAGLKAAEKGLRLNWRIGREVPGHLMGDPLRLGQILLNLLSNAVKFTQSGSVSLDVAARGRRGQRAAIAFEVHDTGIGMDEEQVGKLFRAFSQADSSITRKYGGTGLGLAICRKLLGLLGGDIRVRSDLGVGSTFSFSLEFDVGAGVAPPADVGASDEGPVRWRFDGARILLAEDQALNRQIATELLESAGATVDHAANGREAVDKLFATRRDAYDLVLMDVQMPEMDGLSATQLIRTRSDFADLPIIAMTAHVLDEERRRGHRVGMSDHIGKPYRPGELYGLLAKWLPCTRTVAAAPTSASGGVLPVLPGVDTAAGVLRFGGKVELYLRWLGTFAEAQADAVRAVRAALAAGDPVAAAKRVHVIKGQSGTLGMDTLHEACRCFEDDLRQGRVAESSCAAFAGALDAALAVVRSRGPSPAAAALH